MSPAAASGLPIDSSIPPVTTAHNAENTIAMNSQRTLRLRFNKPLGATAKKVNGVATAKTIAAIKAGPYMAFVRGKKMPQKPTSTARATGMAWRPDGCDLSTQSISMQTPKYFHANHQKPGQASAGISQSRMPEQHNPAGIRIRRFTAPGSRGKAPTLASAHEYPPQHPGHRSVLTGPYQQSPGHGPARGCLLGLDSGSEFYRRTLAGKPVRSTRTAVPDSPRRPGSSGCSRRAVADLVHARSLSLSDDGGN